MNSDQNPEYDGLLRDVLAGGDWIALREFARTHNQVPDEIYDKGEHFWTVLLHKLICSRLDTLALHAASREWLTSDGYSTDMGGY
ncbi:MAG TPA: hypothetical protein VIJ12_04815 [Candidatus Baltobacteraceae bacterium]